MPKEPSQPDPEDLVIELLELLKQRLSGDDTSEEPLTPSPKQCRRKFEVQALANAGQKVHKLGKKGVCTTDERGFPTPGDQSMKDLVLDASEGFVPLWAYGSTLRWCFDDVSLASLDNPTQAERDVRRLITEATLAWDDAAPVKFKEEREAYDFRVVVHNVDRCTPFGCTLASAFFPDSGRHELNIYPRMFQQSNKEQIDTMTHEMGHIFGLRHFFANVRESQWPSEIFGNHRPFSIMNYGSQSELTNDDKHDVKRLYQGVWSGRLADINGTPIRLFKPYHAAGALVTPSFFDEDMAAKRERDN